MITVNNGPCTTYTYYIIFLCDFQYDKQGNVDLLVTPLLAILDTPEKMVLLTDIR